MKVDSINLLVGGPGSGLPFHRHASTWQLQLMGRKEWHLVPPGRMAGALADAVGPWVYPPDAFAREVADRPLGLRPIRCTQKPGEVLYFPHQWWHATVNLDELTLSWGMKFRGNNRVRGLDSSKCEGGEQIKSLSRAFEGAAEPKNSLESQAPSCEDQRSCYWYNILGRVRQPLEAAARLSAAALAKMKESVAAPRDPTGEHKGLLKDTVAYAHCALASALRHRAGTMAKPTAHQALTDEWCKTAANLGIWPACSAACGVGQ